MSKKTYVRVAEAEEVVKELCKKYPDVMWAVKPETVIVLGVENKERGKKSKVLARIKPITGVEKAILKINNISVRYAIDLYLSDWGTWSTEIKQWIIFHELLHISAEVEKCIKHDIMDFRILLDAVKNVSWTDKDAKLPNLLTEDVKFNLDLRPGLDDMDENGEIEGEEEDKD